MEYLVLVNQAGGIDLFGMILAEVHSVGTSYCGQENFLHTL